MHGNPSLWEPLPEIVIRSFAILLGPDPPGVIIGEPPPLDEEKIEDIATIAPPTDIVFGVDEVLFPYQLAITPDGTRAVVVAGVTGLHKVYILDLTEGASFGNVVGLLDLDFGATHVPTDIVIMPKFQGMSCGNLALVISAARRHQRRNAHRTRPLAGTFLPP